MTRNQSDLSVVHHPAELMQKVDWNRRAIGPDAWYNDDFNFDKAQHSFADDPLLKQQYGQLLDMRYNFPGAPVESQQSSNKLDPSTVQICHESEMEHKPVISRRSNTWHGDKFAAELQLFEKKNSQQGLLQVKHLGQTNQSPKRSLDSSKEHWTPTKAIDEIRKVKEAPPKNLVQDRRKKFEKSDEESFTLSDINNALEDAQKEAEDRQKKHSKIVSDFALSDSKDSTGSDTKDSDSEPSNSTQKKRSVLELLNDFEKKSQQLQEEEKKMVMKTGSSTGTRRRVFSDTETMMYDTSSDENDSAFDHPPKPEQSPEVRKTSLPTLLPSNKLSEVQSDNQYMQMTPSPVKPARVLENHPPAKEEDEYLEMTPPTERKPSSIVSASSNTEEQNQERRPSQSVVLEHLIMEFGHERAKAIMDSFTKEDKAAQPAESPNYQEIDGMDDSKGHYEYLFKATSNEESKNYESVYQEIPDEQPMPKKATPRSPEMLPDIIGNAPAGRGHSSSDADDEGGKDQNRSLFEVSDTFTPASFYLDKGRKPSDSNSNARPEFVGSVNSLSSRELPQTPIEEKQNKLMSDAESVSSSRRESSSGYPRASPMKYPPNTFLKQDMNLTYQSVYENEDIGFTSSSSTDQLAQPQQQAQKVPYYVADIGSSTSKLDQIPAQDNSTVKKRRAQTPDSFLLEGQSYQQKMQGPPMNQDGVVRSKSLEGLLGDGPAGGPRDSVQVNMHHYPNVIPQSPSVSSFRSTPLPARGHDPPPIPEGVPPLDLSSYWQQTRPPLNITENDNGDDQDDDETWRESLRRASARVKQSPEHTLPVPRLIPPPGHHPMMQQQPSPHINGYVWDQREQRFYRLNVDPTSPPNPRLFRQPFLDQGLPIHTNTDNRDEQLRIKKLTHQRPKSVGPSTGSSNQPATQHSMMGRPNSTLPTSVNKLNAPQSAHHNLHPVSTKAPSGKI